MIQTYSSTIRRKEMESVLTCMVDEKIGPGEMNVRLIQSAKEIMHFDGAIALRSPSIALQYALNALDLQEGSKIMLSALAPSWQIITVERLGYVPLVLDVLEENGLVPIDIVKKGMEDGGKVLIFTESMGILPTSKELFSLGIPVIEDISQSAFACYPLDSPQDSDSASEENPTQLGPRAGMCGLYSIMGMEDKDVITAGGGAMLIAPSRREWIVLKHLYEEAPSTDIMPDMNSALAFVEVKEYSKNEEIRKGLFTAFSRAVMAGRHKTYIRQEGNASTAYSFPLVLNSGFKDVKSYAQKKGIEVRQAYENSIIALRQEALSSSCLCANSLLLRCALFPLYPRLGQKDAERIVKVLASLP